MAVSLRRDGVLALMLERHHLTAAAAGRDPLAVADDLLGLHATDRRSPSLQLRARIDRFDPHDLDKLLDEGRAARIPCMRHTLFIESAALAPLVIAATRKKLCSDHGRVLAASGITRRAYETLAAQIEDALTGRALDARRIREAIGARHQLTLVLALMCDEGRLVRWRGGRGWRLSPPSYRRFDEALPDLQLDAWDEHDAQRELIARYLRRYGPVSERDITWWTGFRTAEVRALLASLDGVAQAELDGEPVLIHEDDVDSAQARPIGLAGEVAFLPLLDPLLQGYKERRRFADPDRLPYVVDPAGNVTSVILAGGRVAGIWDLARDGSEVRTYVFPDASAAVRKRIKSAASELAPLVIELDAMLPLAAQRTGGVGAPLSGPR